MLYDPSKYIIVVAPFLQSLLEYYKYTNHHMSMYNLLDMTAIVSTVYFLTNHNAETLINTFCIAFKQYIGHIQYVV